MYDYVTTCHDPKILLTEIRCPLLITAAHVAHLRRGDVDPIAEVLRFSGGWREKFLV